LILAKLQSIATSSDFREQLWNEIIYQHQTGTHTDTRCDRCHEQKIVDGCYTNQCIQHQLGFLTAQDGSYDTKWDSLQHKTVHMAPNGIFLHFFHSRSLLTSRKPSQLHREGLYQLICSSTHRNLLSHHRTTFISGIFFVLIVLRKLLFQLKGGNPSIPQ
jgi:hypothetical protein